MNVEPLTVNPNMGRIAEPFTAADTTDTEPHSWDHLGQ